MKLHIQVFSAIKRHLLTFQVSSINNEQNKIHCARHFPFYNFVDDQNCNNVALFHVKTTDLSTIIILKSKTQKPMFSLRNRVLRVCVVPRKILDLTEQKFLRGTLSQRYCAKNVLDKILQFTTIPRSKNEKKVKSQKVKIRMLGNQWAYFILCDSHLAHLASWPYLLATRRFYWTVSDTVSNQVRWHNIEPLLSSKSWTSSSSSDDCGPRQRKALYVLLPASRVTLLLAFLLE